MVTHRRVKQALLLALAVHHQARERVGIRTSGYLETMRFRWRNHIAAWNNSARDKHEHHGREGHKAPQTGELRRGVHLGIPLVRNFGFVTRHW